LLVSWPAYWQEVSDEAWAKAKIKIQKKKTKNNEAKKERIILITKCLNV